MLRDGVQKGEKNTAHISARALATGAGETFEVGVEVGKVVVCQVVDEADRHERQWREPLLADLLVRQANGRGGASLQEDAIDSLVNDEALVYLGVLGGDNGGAIAGGDILARPQDGGEQVVTRGSARDARQVR